MNSLFMSLKENVLFVLEFLGCVVAVFLIAYLIEKYLHRKNNDTERILSTRKDVLSSICVARLTASWRTVSRA